MAKAHNLYEKKKIGTEYDSEQKWERKMIWARCLKWSRQFQEECIIATAAIETVPTVHC